MLDATPSAMECPLATNPAVTDAFLVARSDAERYVAGLVSTCVSIAALFDKGFRGAVDDRLPYSPPSPSLLPQPPWVVGEARSEGNGHCTNDGQHGQSMHRVCETCPSSCAKPDSCTDSQEDMALVGADERQHGRGMLCVSDTWGPSCAKPDVCADNPMVMVPVAGGLGGVPIPRPPHAPASSVMRPARATAPASLGTSVVGHAVTSKGCMRSTSHGPPPLRPYGGQAQDRKLEALCDGRPTCAVSRPESQTARLWRLILEPKHEQRPRSSSVTKAAAARQPQSQRRQRQPEQAPAHSPHKQKHAGQSTIPDAWPPRNARMPHAARPDLHLNLDSTTSDPRRPWRVLEPVSRRPLSPSQRRLANPTPRIRPPPWPRAGKHHNRSFFSRIRTAQNEKQCEVEEPREEEEEEQQSGPFHSALRAEIQSRYDASRSLGSELDPTSKDDMWKLYQSANALKMSIDDILLVKSVFDAFDKDGSGALDIEEFEAAVLALLKKQLNDSSAITMDRAKSISGWCFWEANTDGDGRIQFLEFLKWYSSNGFNEELLLSDQERWVRKIAKQYHLTPDYVESIKRCFDRCDKDKSGEIERAEFREVLYKLLKVPPHLELPQTRVSYFWSQIDSDNSGRAVFEEFLQWYNRYFDKSDRDCQAPFEDFYKHVRRLGAKYLDPPAFSSTDGFSDRQQSSG